MKSYFIGLLQQIDRPGIMALIEYLEVKTDFFIAPASTSFHGSCEGGLVEHSVEVYKNLLHLVNNFGLCCNPESLIVCGLLHDVCKANFYRKGFRNRKNDENGTWERIEVYEVNDQFPIGHGEKSVIILQRYIRLTEEEILSIRWHMGGFDDAGGAYSSSRALSSAMRAYPLVVALQMADLASVYFSNK